LGLIFGEFACGLFSSQLSQARQTIGSGETMPTTPFVNPEAESVSRVDAKRYALISDFALGVFQFGQRLSTVAESRPY
jgi:hypothetical protein